MGITQTHNQDLGQYELIENDVRTWVKLRKNQIFSNSCTGFLSNLHKNNSLCCTDYTNFGRDVALISLHNLPYIWIWVKLRVNLWFNAHVKFDNSKHM